MAGLALQNVICQQRRDVNFVEVEFTGNDKLIIESDSAKCLELKYFGHNYVE